MKFLTLLILLLIQCVVCMQYNACNTSWPDLELILPVAFTNNYWHVIFFRSMLLFWPIEVSRIKLVAVVDEEVSTQHLSSFQSLAKEHSHRFAGDIRTEFIAKSSYYGSGKFNNPGYDRQQFLMFYPENYTTSEFVGFVDTDALFFTYVDLTDIFENGKPIIHGRSGPYRNSGEVWQWTTMSNTTYNVMGLLEPTNCMAFFPVVIRARHIVEIRKYLEKKFQLPFYEIFRLYIAPNLFSQFNLFCSYLFEYHRDEYEWYIHELLPDWDYVNPPAWRGQISNVSVYTRKMKYPKPRVALHAKYRHPEKKVIDAPYYLNELLALGMCYSPPFPKSYPWCKLFQSTDYILEDYFMFEMNDWNQVVPFDQRLDAQRLRYRNIGSCYHNFSSSDIDAMKDTFRIEEGWGVHVPSQGRKVFYYTNGTLRTFPNWDTVVALKATDVHGISNTLYNLLPKGEPMPPV